ncbi:DUF4395 family protein [Aggregatilineales bacterium SYSU G02658]
MASIKIPTPLRVYTGNLAEVQVSGATVGEALDALVAAHPDLKTHLFVDGKLRNFVNIFLGDEDVRFLQGIDTPISPDAKLRIIPSIAGGDDAPLVDRQRIRFANGLTIALLVLAFVLNAPLLVLLVAVAQFLGGINSPFAPYDWAYRALIQRGLLSTYLVSDDPQPHRFASLVGAGVNALGWLLLTLGSGLGWLAVWIVIVLANLNFWLRFCMGCWLYYRLGQLGVRSFNAR